jgi:hypothetical protein
MALPAQKHPSHSFPYVTAIHLLYTKMCSAEGNNILFAHLGNLLPDHPHIGAMRSFNAKQALEQHLEFNKPPADAHLFTYRHKGTYHPLMCMAFLNHIHCAAVLAGIPPVTGHTFCIRGMLKYLLWGMSSKAIKVHGRLASDTFKVYLCWQTQDVFGCPNQAFGSGFWSGFCDRKPRPVDQPQVSR